jgi:hypothetical protein
MLGSDAELRRLIQLVDKKSMFSRKRSTPVRFRAFLYMTQRNETRFPEFLTELPDVFELFEFSSISLRLGTLIANQTDK